MTLTPEQLTKSDEEFEAMMADKHPFISLVKMVNGHYIDEFAFYMHKGWIARQESLVVYLPEKYYVSEYEYERTVFAKADGWDDCIDEFKSRLQSAGINYREKE